MLQYFSLLIYVGVAAVLSSDLETGQQLQDPLLQHSTGSHQSPNVWISGQTIRPNRDLLRVVLEGHAELLDRARRIGVELPTAEAIIGNPNDDDHEIVTFVTTHRPLTKYTESLAALHAATAADRIERQRQTESGRSDYVQRFREEQEQAARERSRDAARRLYHERLLQSAAVDRHDT